MTGTAAEDALLADGRRRARMLTAGAGRTYYLAACLLPPHRRRAVFALYGFARTVDDIVDVTTHSANETTPATDRLDRIEYALAETLSAGSAPADTDHHTAALLAALSETVHEFDISAGTFTAFLRSMRMDTPGSAEFRNRYRTFDELAEYTYGSAAVIGLQLLPVLGVDPADDAAAYAARRLGEAFQLTNFIRDVAEDLDRDRIYLPTQELAAFGVDEALLSRDRNRRSTSPELRRALAHMIAVNRGLYREAWPGIAALPAHSRPAITAAAAAYHDILPVIEGSGYAVMARRAVVPRRRRVSRAAAALLSVGTIRTPVPAPGE